MTSSRAMLRPRTRTTTQPPRTWVDGPIMNAESRHIEHHEVGHG
ncbi:hypothetical protein GPROT1_01987 [Gammaproteobacteria bacterium]|nr:hypothetical protein GPROT1_01987 [Gammaproteobacteria bacterium]